MIDLDAVSAFVAFADRLNFTRAAEGLHISQPALHVKIRKLGEQLGVPLYVRHGRTLRLTDAGQAVARFGRETNRGARDLLATLSGSTETEPVILATGEGALLHLLRDAVRDFVRINPAPLQIVTRDRDAMLGMVRSGEAHLGVAALDSIPHDLRATLLARAEPVVVMPSGHPLARKRSLTPRDLEGASLIVPPAGRPHRELIGRVLLEAGTSWRVALEATGWNVMLEFARLGVGLAIVNSTCAIPRGLVAKRLRGVPAAHYHLVHGQRPLGAAAAELARLIRR